MESPCNTSSNTLQFEPGFQEMRRLRQSQRNEQPRRLRPLAQCRFRSGHGVDAPRTDLDLCCTRIDARQAPRHTGNRVGCRHIAPGEQQAVSHRHLTNGVEMAPELAIRVPDIDRRDDSVDTKALGDPRVLAQGVPHGGQNGSLQVYAWHGCKLTAQTTSSGKQGVRRCSPCPAKKE